MGSPPLSVPSQETALLPSVTSSRMWRSSSSVLSKVPSSLMSQTMWAMPSTFEVRVYSPSVLPETMAVQSVSVVE